MMWGMGLMMMIVWVLFLVLIVAGVFVLVRTLGGRGGGASGGTSSALSILEERFARGEIDRDEFEERRRALRG